MPTTFTRSIRFLIPETKNSPAVQVSAVEVGGALSFEVKVLATATKTADLRGLFFDVNASSKLAGLRYLGSDVTDFKTSNQINLGNGANQQGASSPYDVGLEFGTAGIARDSIQSTRFSLFNPATALTLDDIANVDFGARLTSVGAKLMVVAPAAPDARDDAYQLFEDGQAGLAAPSTVPAGTLFALLANDTDADGDRLTITATEGVSHGTVIIIDGPDADTLPGDAVLYTPFEDYSGPDDFYYLISDGHGGTDFAHVTVNLDAVADVPTLSYQILEGGAVNQVLVRVTATQTDADASEFIDRVFLSGLPANVTATPSAVNPATQPGQLVQDFLLTLPAALDSSFDLGITAVAKEVSNADEQSAFTSTHIDYDFSSRDYLETFEGENENMWARGGAYSFGDDRFLGAQGNTSGSIGSTFSASWNVNYKFGLQSTFSVSAGEVDAEVPYSIDIDSKYNEATDWLRFETNQLVQVDGANFSTVSPLMLYTLDLIAQLNGWLQLAADVHIPGTPGTPAVEIAGETIIPAIPGIPGFDFGGSTTINLPNINASPTIMEFDGDSLNLLGLEGDSQAEWDLTEGVSLVAKIPVIETESEAVDTNGDGRSDVLRSSGDDNFLGIKADIDALVTRLLGLPHSPFGIEAEFGPVSVGLDLMNYEMTGWLGVGQQFNMSFGALHGMLEFEDGYVRNFNLNEDFDIHQASSHDANGDGNLEFNLRLTPDVNFQSDLSLVLSLEHTLEFLKAEASVEVPVFDDPKYEIGPAWSYEDTLASTSIKVVGLPSFLMDLGSQDILLDVAVEL